MELSLEQRVDERTRFRLELYNRLDRDLLFRPLEEPRFLQGRIFNPPVVAPILNSQRGYGRGVQVFVQRRTANSLTGWVSYAYGRSSLRDGALGITFPSDYDQRHTVNVFGGYRIRPTVNLSLKHSYGSGFPLPGFYTGAWNNFFLATDRNGLRIPAYQRTDLRINKAFVRNRWQITLFGELVNMLNHENVRFSELLSYNTRTGSSRLRFDKMLPIIPSAGVAVEY